MPLVDTINPIYSTEVWKNLDFSNDTRLFSQNVVNIIHMTPLRVGECNDVVNIDVATFSYIRPQNIVDSALTQTSSDKTRICHYSH